ncbi:MAG: hypothetical protein V3S24_00580, partial [Candidatus Tectomicrobia bacterium]
QAQLPKVMTLPYAACNTSLYLMISPSCLLIPTLYTARNDRHSLLPGYQFEMIALHPWRLPIGARTVNSAFLKDEEKDEGPGCPP